MSAYTEEKIEDFIIRNFKSDIDEHSLEWHRDREDRIVEVVGETDWLIQFDNELPKKLEGKIFIPKETFHRIIKGHGDLNVKIKKIF